MSDYEYMLRCYHESVARGEECRNRIAALESERDKLREALEKIRDANNAAWCPFRLRHQVHACPQPVVGAISSDALRETEAANGV